MGRYRLPGAYLTADIVIFTIRGERLEILLIERGGEPFRGCWALPGGFVEHDEDVDEAARRELEEETGVKGLSLEQLHTFGAPDRDPRGRVVTVAFYTLVPAGKLSPRAGDDAARAQWFDADNLPRLAFDHAAIVALARRRLGTDLEGTMLAASFLPRAFTLADLRVLHELIRGEPIEPRGFRKRILALDRVEETARFRTSGRRRVRLYRLKSAT
ncbi:MAG: NUDIX hydrolase [Isosphaeraceae bacterium]